MAVLILMTILISIVQAIFIGLLAGVVSVSDNEIARAVADAVGQTAASALTTPLSAAVLTVLYFDLRVRKEGFDLELLAERVGLAEPPEGGLRPAPPVAPPPRPTFEGEQPPYWPPPPGWRPPSDQTRE